MAAVCAIHASEAPEWLRSAIIYHIYPSTYADSNGDGIGDLEGIRSNIQNSMTGKHPAYRRNRGSILSVDRFIQ